jgi:hypothetical protein
MRRLVGVDADRDHPTAPRDRQRQHSTAAGNLSSSTTGHASIEPHQRRTAARRHAMKQPRPPGRARSVGAARSPPWHAKAADLNGYRPSKQLRSVARQSGSRRKCCPPDASRPR